MGYTLEERDLALIRRRRGAHNRLGFTVQLCYLRYPGQAMDPEAVPPDAVLAFVAQQVGVPSASWGEYARRDETRREHARDLQAAFGYRWNHINLTGDYTWRQNKRVEKGGFRPLRPTSRA